MLLREPGVLILSRPTRPPLAPVLGCHNQLQLGDPRATRPPPGGRCAGAGALGVRRRLPTPQPSGAGVSRLALPHNHLGR